MRDSSSKKNESPDKRQQLNEHNWRLIRSDIMAVRLYDIMLEGRQINMPNLNPMKLAKKLSVSMILDKYNQYRISIFKAIGLLLDWKPQWQ